MKTSKNRNALLSLTALIALAACGGGGGSDYTASAGSGTSFSGKAVDGYISGATVFCDADNNRIANQGEASTTTNGVGSFTLASSCSSTLVAIGGVDTDTDYAFTGVLSAPAGSSVVTPITTLLANADIVESDLLRALNLPADLDLTHTDPMTDLALLRKNMAVHHLLQQMAHFFTAYVTPDTLLYQRAAQQLSQALQASNTPLFNVSESVDQSIVADTLRNMATSMNLSLSTDDINTIAQALTQQTGSYLVASNGSTLVDIAKNLQDPSKPPAQAPSFQSNYLALTNDTFHLNGQAYTLAQLQSSSGITISGLDTLQFQYTAVGTVDFDRKVNVGVTVHEIGGSGRIFQAKVEHLRLQRDHDTGVITAGPTPDTVVYAYGRDQNGIEVNAMLDGSNFNAVSASTNSLTIDYAELLNRIANHPDKPSSFNPDQFLNIKGSFAVKAVVTHNLNARYSNGDPLPTVNMGIYNTNFGVTGYGIEGRVNIQ